MDSYATEGEPMSASISNPAYRRAEIGGASTEQLRVIMADDDTQEHLLVAMAADRSPTPLHIEFVTDGAQLLMHLGAAASVSEFPDVIVLDLSMPGLDGVQTLEELQAHPLMWQIPVVVFSSSTRVEDEIRSYERGAIWFETKPSTLSGMHDFVERMTSFARRAPYETSDSSILSLLNADLAADVEDRTLAGEFDGS